MLHKLFESSQLGDLKLPNRIIMAPMTRSRADAQTVPGEFTALYYRQRASVGLIISEGINVSVDAIGSPFTPGITTHAQIDAWKQICKAVHEAGGHIFAQLWHSGRVGHSQVRGGYYP